MSNNPTELRNEELRKRQQEQYEEWQKKEASSSKKWWFIGCGGCGGCLVIIILLAIALTTFTGAVIDTVQKQQEQTKSTQDSTAQKPLLGLDDSPYNKEKNNDANEALENAKIYSELYMSKQSIYDQLTSRYGDYFSPEAAQYAIDNLQVDYKENAVKKAESYHEDGKMSKAEIYDQLTSQFGEKFTEEEAQYAVDQLVE
ncbi:Ltp family lipoprotein [Staphylococcus rostri]|uniref:Putative host cell surface-exposed lipoprotein Ltp-like HTH region domain-containing protein n=1 Tax=Staphylococcus rostri TaxID=522262 RepID=A0A2K3YHC5_9STAP|nr:Ltp family lipoprotein [Staphylococcus rostri]PNZ24638.1 hypothetical protein CD122_10830 [Staphylococcus rostri]